MAVNVVLVIYIARLENMGTKFKKGILFIVLSGNVSTVLYLMEKLLTILMTIKKIIVYAILQIMTQQANCKKSAKNRDYSFAANNHKNRRW